MYEECNCTSCERSTSVDAHLCHQGALGRKQHTSKHYKATLRDPVIASFVQTNLLEVLEIHLLTGKIEVVIKHQIQQHLLPRLNCETARVFIDALVLLKVTEGRKAEFSALWL